jgi:hypothetical protein
MRPLFIFCCFLISLLNVEVASAACAPNEPAFSELVTNKTITITGPYTVDELERENMIEVRSEKEKLPFGYGYEQWLKFKAAISHDEKIYFMIKREGHFYQDGHILVRDGCVVRFLPGEIS